MYVAVRHRTFPQVYVEFDTIWYVLVGFRIKCPNLNQNVPERAETYDNLHYSTIYFFHSGMRHKESNRTQKKHAKACAFYVDSHLINL